MRSTLNRAAILALALLVGTCAACGTAPPPAPKAISPSARVRQLENRTVALVRPGAQGPYCSGVWVSGELLLTANHCVADLDVGDTVTYDTRSDVREDGLVIFVRAAALVARDEDHDLALVRDVGAPAHGFAQISEPYTGQIAFSMGHPLGLWWSYSQGEVSAIRLKSFGGEEMWWVQATAPISPGNSGGGLFDEDGNLIGVCAATMRNGQNINLFVHPRYAKALVDGFLKGQAK